MAEIVKDLGVATAYGYAKANGYTGTEEEFGVLMASYATVADEAAASAAAASASADDSADSAAEAAQKVLDAAAQVTLATEQAQAAASKATEASGYATDASGSATDAETYKTQAQGFSQDAGADAALALGYKNAAQTYAGNASTSATNAADSASAASTSATNASTSATNAANSATAAAASATSAAESAAHLVIDDELSTESENAVQNKLITTALETKAEVDGAYEQMTVGNAEQLVSSVGIEDSVPYNFRTSGGSADIGDREVDKIVGGTIAWNQHIQNGNFAENAKWVKLGSGSVMTIANGECAVTPAANYDGIQSYNQTFNIANGHKWFIAATLKADSARTLVFGISDWSSHYTVRKSFAVSTTYEEKAFIGAETEGDTQNGAMMVYDTQGSAGVKFYIKNCIVIDLTQMFGSTIADYIYSIEQSTAGAGVAWFRKLFPKPYYAYNAGELMSVQTSAHKTIGFNAWDEEWELGSIDSNGQNTENSFVIRSKNYIPVIPGATYYFYCGSGDGATNNPFFYDADKAFTQRLGSYVCNSTFVVPQGCYYMRFGLAATYNYGTTYKNDICINLSWDGERNGEYEEYKQWVYPLDSDLVLRGIPKLSSGNDLYYDGDTYESDGTVTRKYGIRAYQNGDETDGATMITDGTNTVYALTTPTIESADPFTNPQIVDDFGTEEYVDARDVAIPVGHETFYQANLKAKLEMAPNSPDGDGDYVVRQTNGKNEYVPLLFPASDIPAAPSENGNYVLKCTVANGTPSFSWTAES